jgi:tetratricopeptide (TPR) repeat protein
MTLRLSFLACLILAAPLAAEVNTRLIKVPDVVAHAQRIALEGKGEEAREELQALVKLAPGDADAWMALAWVHKDLGQKAESAACLAKVKELMPGEAASLITEGAAQHQEQKQEVHQELVAKGVIGYTVLTGTVKDIEVQPKPNKWTRRWDKAKVVNIEAAAVEDGPGDFNPPAPKPKAKPKTKLMSLEELTEGPKIKAHP